MTIKDYCDKHEESKCIEIILEDTTVYIGSQENMPIIFKNKQVHNCWQYSTTRTAVFRFVYSQFSPEEYKVAIKLKKDFMESLGLSRYL